MAILNQNEIEHRLEVVTQRFSNSRDPSARSEIEWWSLQLADRRSVAVLEAAVLCCCDEDLRETEVSAALQYLENRVAMKWPFQHFRDALKLEKERGRRLHLRASLIEIKIAVGLEPD